MGSRNRIARGSVLALLLSLGGCGTLLGPTQPDSNWHTHESPRFTLFVRPASFAEQNAAQIAGLGRPGTSFVTEGLASAVLSERYYPYGKTLLYQWTKSNTGQIPPLAGLADDEKWHDYPERVAYKASASFLAYLLETAGPTRLKQIYYVPSRDFGRRFQEIYGRSLEAAEQSWKEFCARQPG